MQLLKGLFTTLIMLAALAAAPAAQAAGDEPGLDAAPVVNINEAGAAELAEALTGVGEKKAQAIVQYREKHGDFISTSGLTGVRGIGDATVRKNEGRIRLE